LGPLTDPHKPPSKDITQDAGAVSKDNILRVTVKPLFGQPPLQPPLRSLQFIGVYDEKKLKGEHKILSIPHLSNIPDYLSPPPHQILDPKRVAEGKITFETDHGFAPDTKCKFKVSQHELKVMITFTSLQDGREIAKVRIAVLC